MPNTDLTPLTPEMCEEVSDKNKAKSLLEAYKIAAGGHDLAHFKEILADHQEQIAAAETRKREAAESKAKRKSDAAAKKAKAEAAADDDMDVDEDEVEDKPKSKKRKKAAAESDDESEKVRAEKTPCAVVARATD